MDANAFMKPDINGKWTGELVYGPNFGKLEHEALVFTLDVEQHGDEFIGISRDVDGVGINPYAADVDGFVDEEQINFVREYYPPALFGYENGSVTATTGGPATEISFSGTYNAATGEYEGEWILLSDYTVYGNVFFDRNNGGTWRMKREN